MYLSFVSLKNTVKSIVQFMWHLKRICVGYQTNLDLLSTEEYLTFRLNYFHCLS